MDPILIDTTPIRSPSRDTQEEIPVQNDNDNNSGSNPSPSPAADVAAVEESAVTQSVTKEPEEASTSSHDDTVKATAEHSPAAVENNNDDRSSEQRHESGGVDLPPEERPRTPPAQSPSSLAKQHVGLEEGGDVTGAASQPIRESSIDQRSVDEDEPRRDLYDSDWGNDRLDQSPSPRSRSRSTSRSREDSASIDALEEHADHPNGEDNDDNYDDSHFQGDDQLRSDGNDRDFQSADSSAAARDQLRDGGNVSGGRRNRVNQRRDRGGQRGGQRNRNQRNKSGNKRDRQQRGGRNAAERDAKRRRDSRSNNRSMNNDRPPFNDNIEYRGPDAINDRFPHEAFGNRGGNRGANRDRQANDHFGTRDDGTWGRNAGYRGGPLRDDLRAGNRFGGARQDQPPYYAERGFQQNDHYDDRHSDFNRRMYDNAREGSARDGWNKESRNQLVASWSHEDRLPAANASRAASYDDGRFNRDQGWQQPQQHPREAVGFAHYDNRGGMRHQSAGSAYDHQQQQPLHQQHQQQGGRGYDRPSDYDQYGDRSEVYSGSSVRREYGSGSGIGQHAAASSYQQAKPSGGGLPHGWQEYFTNDGAPYYYNVQTRQTQWTRPN